MVWVIVDPLVGLLEPFVLSTSREHRVERIAQAKVLRQKQNENRDNLLREVLVKEKLEHEQWREELIPIAEQLASMLISDEVDFDRRQCEAIGMGVNAWRIGGLSCMKELRNMAIDLAEQKNKSFVDYTGLWWDGIGSWRQPTLV